MKVLLFSSQWPEYMIELANALAFHCQTILMIPTNHRFSTKHKELISNRVIFEPYEVIFFKSIRKNAAMIFYILRVLWKHRPEILHIQANGHRLFYWIFFLKPWKTKIVNTIHDPVKHMGDELSKAIDDKCVVYWGRIFTDRFIVHGKFLKEQLSKSYKIKISRISIIPHGQFGIFKKFQKQRQKEDSNTILFFGRIWKYKGLDILIDAANILTGEYPELKFIIAGTGEDISKYREKVLHQKNIIFDNRRIANEEVGNFFEMASFVVLPYIEATQSGVIPIAYAYGKPVIATKVGSIPEVVFQNFTGLLVEPNSVESLTEAIRNLFKNTKKRKEMGRNAFNFANTELSWKVIAEKVFELYNSIL